MTPELLALETYLTDLFRDAGSARVKAEQAGLDTNQLDIANTSVANIWHTIIQRAQTENLLDNLIDVSISALPLHGGSRVQVQKLYDAYRAAQSPPAQLKPSRPPPRRTGANLSDYRTDERIDRIHRDNSDLRAQVAGLIAQVAGLTAQVATLNDLVRTLATNDNPPSLSGAQFLGLLIAILLMATIVFVGVYWGGNR